MPHDAASLSARNQAVARNRSNHAMNAKANAARAALGLATPAKRSLDSDPDVLRYREEKARRAPALQADAKAKMGAAKKELKRQLAMLDQSRKGGRPKSKGLAANVKVDPRDVLIRALERAS